MASSKNPLSLEKRYVSVKKSLTYKSVKNKGKFFNLPLSGEFQLQIIVSSIEIFRQINRRYRAIRGSGENLSQNRFSNVSNRVNTFHIRFHMFIR